MHAHLHVVDVSSCGRSSNFAVLCPISSHMDENVLSCYLESGALLSMRMVWLTCAENPSLVFPPATSLLHPVLLPTIPLLLQTISLLLPSLLRLFILNTPSQLPFRLPRHLPRPPLPSLPWEPSRENPYRGTPWEPPVGPPSTPCNLANVHRKQSEHIPFLPPPNPTPTHRHAYVHILTVSDRITQTRSHKHAETHAESLARTHNSKHRIPTPPSNPS